MPEFKHEIVEELGVISQSGTWQRELNLVSWSDRPPKYDIRDWGPDHKSMGKGITLTKEQVKALRDILDKLDLDGDDD